MRPTMQLLGTCVALGISALSIGLMLRTRVRKQSLAHDERIADALGAIILAARAHATDTVSETELRETLTAIEATARDSVAMIRSKIARRSIV